MLISCHGVSDSFIMNNSFIMITTQISNLVRTMRFWNNLHQIGSKSKVWKANNFTIFGSYKTKGWKQNNQNLRRLPLPGEENLSFSNG